MVRPIEKLYLKPAYERDALAAKGLELPQFINASWYSGGFLPHFDHVNPGQLRIHDPDCLGYDLTKDFCSMKPGRFFKQYFGDKFTDAQIATMANQVAIESAPPTLCIARTPKEIYETYLSGPKSCMQYMKSSGFQGHPVEIYGGPDLGLAYLKKSPDRIVARALVWPEKKIFGRCYGNEVALKRALTTAGYKSVYGSGDGQGKDAAGPWLGARLGCIPYPVPKPSGPCVLKHPVFLVPYSDHWNYANHITDKDGEWLQVCTKAQCVHPYHHFPSGGGNNSSCSPEWIIDPKHKPPEPVLSKTATQTPTGGPGQSGTITFSTFIDLTNLTTSPIPF